MPTRFLNVLSSVGSLISSVKQFGQRAWGLQIVRDEGLTKLDDRLGVRRKPPVVRQASGLL